MKKYKKYQYCTDLIKKKHAIRWFGIKEWIQGTKIRNLKWKKFRGQFLKEFLFKGYNNNIQYSNNFLQKQHQGC